MTDEQRLAQALRHGIDQELAAVQAGQQARDRLLRSARDQTRARRRARSSWRLRPVLALPLAGALVAAVIAGAVVIPSALREEAPRVTPAAPGPPLPPAPVDPAPVTAATPSISASAVEEPPVADPASPEMPRPAPTDPAPTDPAPAELRLTVTPSSATPGQSIRLTVKGISMPYQTLKVSWGDRSTVTEVAGRCATATRSGSVAVPVHRYPRTGRYTLTAVLTWCDDRTQSRVTTTVAVVTARTVAPTETPATARPSVAPSR